MAGTNTIRDASAPAVAPAGDVPLDRASPLPLYAQIKQRLIILIQNWDADDARFLSDEQLCSLYGVSRDTVRQAVSELVQAGLLTRSRGLGTFVAREKLEERFSPGMDFLHQWAAKGVTLQITPLLFCRRTADPLAAKELELAPGEKVLFIKRLRGAARVPVAIDHRAIPAGLVADWTEEDAPASPLHALWGTVPIATGDFSIEAGIAGPEEVEYLHLAPGAPVLTRTLRYRDQAGRVVMTGHTVHRADFVRYSLSVPMTRDPGERPSLDPNGLHQD